MAPRRIVQGVFLGGEELPFDGEIRVMTLTCIQRRIIDYSMMVIHQTSLVNGKEHTLWCSAGANDSSLTLILRVQCKEHPTCVRRNAR